MWWKCVLLITCLRLTSCEIIVPPAGEDWWESSIIYEIFPLSFKDSDGDGFGDFKGSFYGFYGFSLITTKEYCYLI